MTKIKLSILASALLVSSLGANDDFASATVYSATKSEQSIKDVTSNVNVITAEDIEERRYTTVVEALNSLAGISFTQKGSIGSSTSIMLRGMDTKRVLVMIDGINFKDPSSTSGTSFAHLMIGDIERIEVVKGPQSSIWGNDATAGIINIITKKATEGNHSSINIEKGSFNTNKVQINMLKKEKNYDTKLFVSRITSDGFTSLAPFTEDLDNYEDDGYKNTTVNLISNYKISDTDKIGINYTKINALSNYDGYNQPNKIQRSDIEDTLYSIYYTKDINNHHMKIKYNNSDFFKDAMDTTTPTFVKIFNGNIQSYEIVDNFKYDDTQSLLFGSSYDLYDVFYERVDNNNKAKRIHSKSAFVTNIQKNVDYVITESIRVDDFSTSGKEYTGKIGVKYYINNIEINTNYGTAFNAPNIMELLNPWGTEGRDIVQPEKTKGFDISLAANNFAMTYFNNKVTDMIAWYDPDTSNSWTIQDGYFKNYTGASVLKGYELSYAKDIYDDILFNINYTKLNTKNSDGEFLAKRPKETIKFAFDYYGFDKLHFNLNGEYVGTRFNKKNLEGDQTGRYTIFNSAINYDLNKDQKIYFKIDNIANKYYMTSSDDNNNRYATSPRAFYIGMKASF
jgi:vitamin B12 transporter